MSNLENRPNTAVLVVDAQNGVVKGGTNAVPSWRMSGSLVTKAKPNGARRHRIRSSHTNLYWTYQTALGRAAGTAATADVEFGTASAPQA